jgi:hypothetical protein
VEGPGGGDTEAWEENVVVCNWLWGMQHYDRVTWRRMDMCQKIRGRGEVKKRYDMEVRRGAAM